MECGSLHDVSALTSSCLEPGERRQLLASSCRALVLLVLLLSNLGLPQSLLLHAFLRGGPLSRA